MADETPVKRGPSRSRTTDPAETMPAPKKSEVKASPPDPRIGQFQHDGARWALFPDGAEYRCVDGVVTERVN